MKRLLCLLPLLAACGHPVEKTSYLLMDAEALQAGNTLRIGTWQGAPVMPVSADVGDLVRHVGPEGDTRIELEPGSLGYVRGAEGRVAWLRLSVDVRDDALVLDATEEAARALAKQLDAELTPLESGYRLQVSELLERAAYLKPPTGVREVIPDTPVFAPPVRVVPAAQPSAITVAGGVGAVDDTEAPARMGVYTGENGYVILDASGGFHYVTACGAQPVDGTYALSSESVVLTPREGEVTAWRWSGQDLVGPDGAVFAGGVP